MRHQGKYFLLYLSIVCFFMGGAVPFAQAQQANTLEKNTKSQEGAEVLNQAELEQILAPIALYPDTLLSHILVASTYPLEVVQAARWRAKNQTLDEQEAQEAVEDKDWDPSVKALVPFNDLLQTFSEDLDWLQSLGEAFLFNEDQVLASVQGLRQKAYAQGNLRDNDYLNVDQDEGSIVIETIEKEVVYVPYYDTRLVYGSGWWGAYPPHYWHRPSHYVWRAGLYWSPGFYIRPSFYFGGFNWRDRHLVVDYHYRNTSHSNWSQHFAHNPGRTVRVREYPRWSHNTLHRRGVRYLHSQNANRYVSADKGGHGKTRHQIDKQRVLNVEHLKNKHRSQQVKQGLAAANKGHKQSAHKEPFAKAQQGRSRQPGMAHSSGQRNKPDGNNHQQRLINVAKGQQRSRGVTQARGGRKTQYQRSLANAPQAHSAKEAQPYVQNQVSHKSTYRTNSNERQGKSRDKSQGRSSSVHNKSRPVNTSRSEHKQSRH